MSNKPHKLRLLAVGGAHVDRRGQISGLFVPGASNPGIMREDVGGGVFNALRNAAGRGIAASLMSLRGGDVDGDHVAGAIVAAGIKDLSAVFLDRSTPSYTAILDRDGELIAGLADMELYDTAFPKQLTRRASRDAVEAADAVLCDANMPPAAVESLAALAHPKPLYAIAISPVKALRLADVLSRISCLFMNVREAAGLSGQGSRADPLTIIEALRSRGLKSGIITDGHKAITGFDQDGVFSLTPPQPRRIADVTGAGDALAGVTIAALMRGLGLREALREGLAAAVLAVESPAAVPDLNEKAFAGAMALVPETKPIAQPRKAS
jgi:sugar/nucleoside kinase (ribokinase family)